MGDIAEFVACETQGSQMTVETLERALELAKQGEITAVCVVMDMRSGSTEWMRSGYYSAPSMVGMIEMAKIGILRDECDG